MSRGSARPAAARRTSATTTKNRGRPPSAPLPSAGRAGFTLVELVIVLVILAVAGALAVPALRPALESVRFEAAVRRTASFLDDARRRAVLERKVLEVRCRVDDGLLEIAGERPFPIPHGVALASCEPGQARYFPQGSATPLKLVLRGAGGRAAGLSVGTFTGLARIEALK